MNNRRLPHNRALSVLCGLMLLLDAPLSPAEPPAAAVSAFNAYSRGVESRLAQQHRSLANFLTPISPADDRRLRTGELLIDHLTPPALAGALLHHWRGTAFAPGATPADFLRLMRAFNTYPQHFAPQVLEARTLSQTGDRFQAFVRIRQRHVITVVMDTTYDVTFAQLDPQHGYSLSQSTRIAEIDNPGTPTEHALGPTDEHGFLWRLNTYWSYEQRDGGLYLQIEAVTLTRAVPTGLGWAIRPYIESIPRESLEFTLRSAVNAIRH